MGKFIIQGKNILHGNITPQGAKNEALQVICAVLLTSEPVTISNIPDIADVRNLISILKAMGVKVSNSSNSQYTFQADKLSLSFFESDEFIKMSNTIRASIMTVGPLLGRFGIAYAAKPGGDKIGRRPLTTHFEGFVKLGASYSTNETNIVYKILATKLKGNYLLLNEASVTGTANIIMAAVLAEGITTIFNAACEPYISQLCKMLISMGANISGVGSNLLTVEGVKELHGCCHTILPDMIEVGSFIGMAAITNSDITIKNCSVSNLGIIPYTFQKLGINFKITGDDIHVFDNESYEIEKNMDGSILTVSDAPWPGFTPDLISIIIVTAIQASGSILIHQKMFESRLFFVDKLQSMGAQIILCDPHRATIIGLNHKYLLRGTTMYSPDIRAGVALVIAALSAEGTSIIQNSEQIDRGYENIVERLALLGAKIERVV